MTRSINLIERTEVQEFHLQSINRSQLDEYQRIATKSAIYPGQGTPFGVMYCALGLAEAGEVQNKVKKMFRDDEAIEFIHVDEQGSQVLFSPITTERRAAIIKEMGGVLWYLAALAGELETTLSEIALANLEELCDRGERNVLQGDGDNR